MYLKWLICCNAFGASTHHDNVYEYVKPSKRHLWIAFTVLIVNEGNLKALNVYHYCIYTCYFHSWKTLIS